MHRDLKPENIIFINEQSDSKLKVIDFGTSRKFDSTKKMTKRLGTVKKKKNLFIISLIILLPKF